MPNSSRDSVSLNLGSGACETACYVPPMVDLGLGASVFRRFRGVRGLTPVRLPAKSVGQGGCARVSSGPRVLRLALIVIFASEALTPSSAAAFCRTTTTALPASYSPTRGCFREGLLLFWKGSCIGYSANQAASAKIDLATVNRVTDAAFAAWNDATCASGAKVGITTSNLGPVECNEVRYNQNGPNQNVIVFRETTWPYTDPNSTLGLTTVTFNEETGEIYDVDMEINGTAGNLTTSDTVPANGYDLQSVLTHEAGHFLGLAHATDAEATMFARYDRGTSTLRTLTNDDAAGLCDIYPSTTNRRVSTTISASGIVPASACEPAPRHGFGSGCAENPPAPVTSSSGCAVGGLSTTEERARASSPLLWCAVLGAIAAVAGSRRCRLTR